MPDAGPPTVSTLGGSAGTSPAAPPNPHSTLRRDEVLALARLAHLDLSAEEADRLTGDLARILEYVRQLEELDVSGVPPTAHVQIERLPLRADDERPSLPREIALGEAPRVQDDGFAVPAFVDEG